MQRTHTQRRKAGKANRSPQAKRARRAQPRGEASRIRTSVALSAEEVAWLEQEAPRQGVSVSAVVSQTIQFSLRDVAWRRCCAALGWPESLSHDEAAAADADLKAMGLL